MEQNKAPRGTNDVLPRDAAKWQFAEKTALGTAALYGYGEIRTPVFEHTEVFDRGIGDTTDVVQKEMYTFADRGGRSVTLRPELTAGVVRAVVERGEIYGALPLKTCYIGSCYRYEKPQAGRLREFHQFGVECFGAGDPMADAEVILLARAILRKLGLGGYRLEINSIGCPVCRAKYSEALRSYFGERRERLCETCRGRLERNPMRIFDCKSPECGAVAAGAPKMLDYLCGDCAAHFGKVKEYLAATGAEFAVNPGIVRGLDYYTRTVFEFVPADGGSTVLGGGRYDGLVEKMGGPPTPALGFAMGLERVIMAMTAAGAEFPGEPVPDICVVTAGDGARLYAADLCERLRAEGFSVAGDISGRGLKAQMKYADKRGARFTAVIGDDELTRGACSVKNMRTGEETPAALDGIGEALRGLLG